MKIILLIFFLFIIYSCAVTQQTQEETGMRLWKENCSRCHNIPSAGSFSNDEWEVIISHMRVRAHLTEKEANLIARFIQSAN